MNKENNIMHNELKDYYFDLPEEFIAKYPIIPRDHAKLMVLNGTEITHDYFYNLDQYLPENSILIFNDTKVSFRRVYLWNSKLNTQFEVVFLEQKDKNLWKCLIRRGRKIKKNDILLISNYRFKLEHRDQNFFYLSCWMNETPALINIDESEIFFESYGQPPIPPYLKRKSEDLDKEYYQTVFAKKSGSVAAPTASLHFTNELINKLKKKFKIVYINLQIGYGTFSPLTEHELKKNELHEEIYEIPEDTSLILNANKNSHVLIAVGTTTLRALEDNYLKHNYFKSGKFSTKIFIKPPQKIYSSDYLITNFHLPASSLFMLVCAFGGTKNLKHAYEVAKNNQYRFFSYGDGMIIKNIHAVK